jgi:hypothetical protein
LFNFLEKAGVGMDGELTLAAKLTQNPAPYRSITAKKLEFYGK